MVPRVNDRLVWIDCEMTGLDLRADALIEVAALVTDFELNVLGGRWYPRAYYGAPAKAGNHRALSDIRESIEELRYYRATVFVPPPGPDSETVRALAAQHGGSLSDPPPEPGGGPSTAV